MPVSPIDNPNARKWLDLIAYAEGTDKNRTGGGYDVLFGHGKFKDFSRHPDTVIRGGGYSSAAAGRYQMMPATWEGTKQRLGLKDFGPGAQDVAAIELIRARGVDPYKEAITPQAVAKLAPEWASLPTLAGKSYYNQPVVPFNTLKKAVEERVYNFPRQSQVSSAAPPPTTNNPVISSTSPEVDVQPFDFNGQLTNVLLEKVAPALAQGQVPASFGKFAELTAQADDLELSEDPEAAQLAAVLRSQAQSSISAGVDPLVDPTQIAQAVIALKSQEDDYYDRSKKIQETLSNIKLTQTTQEQKVNATTAAKPEQQIPRSTSNPVRFAGVQITSAVDASGEPGFDFVVADGKRGAPFVSPFNAEILKVSKNPAEFRLEQGATQRGYGNNVELRITTPEGKQADVLVAHFDQLNPNLKPGMRINTGTLLGTQGRTGSTTGAHVSMDFFDPNSSSASPEILKIRDSVRYQIQHGLPYHPSTG